MSEETTNELEQPILNEDGHIPSARARAVAQWVHSHKESTSDNVFGYTLYQYLRSAAASVPYGLSMAGTWLGFQKLQEFGEASSGLKVAEIAKAPEMLGKLSEMTAGQRGGFRMAQFFANPLTRTGTMIATSFTLYRATSKIGKWVNEYLFDPEDTLEQTTEKVEKLPEMLKEKCKEVYLPEGHSTFISAFVLSAVVLHAAAAGNTPHTMKALEKTRELLGNRNYSFKMEGWSHFWKEAIANPKANFVPFAAINSLAYSLFFELGDRRFKDKQISRGLWAGKSSSIGSSSKSHPSLLRAPLDDGSDITAFGEKQDVGELPEGSRMDDKLSVLTSEPSFLRFLGRRFVPTAVGITAYSAFKMRAGYQFLGKFPNPENIGTVKGFLHNSWIEGANTSLFAVVPWVTDWYAPKFDKAVNSLEAAVSGRSYDQVVAGYQPKQKRETMLASASQESPDSKVNAPIKEQARAAEPVHSLSAGPSAS